MKKALQVLITLLLLTPLAFGNPATEPDKVKAKPELQTAIFTVPDLTMGLAKGLVKDLSQTKGILSAKPDPDSGNFQVTFESAHVTTDMIQKSLQQKAPKATLAKVGPADPKLLKKDCGKCPHAKSCGSKKED